MAHFRRSERDAIESFVTGVGHGKPSTRGRVSIGLVIGFDKTSGAPADAAGSLGCWPHGVTVPVRRAERQSASAISPASPGPAKINLPAAGSEP